MQCGSEFLSDPYAVRKINVGYHSEKCHINGVFETDGVLRNTRPFRHFYKIPIEYKNYLVKWTAKGHAPDDKCCECHTTIE